jgi:hypothetical protein
MLHGSSTNQLHNNPNLLLNQHLLPHNHLSSPNPNLLCVLLLLLLVQVVSLPSHRLRKNALTEVGEEVTEGEVGVATPPCLTLL